MRTEKYYNDSKVNKSLLYKLQSFDLNRSDGWDQNSSFYRVKTFFLSNRVMTS